MSALPGVPWAGLAAQRPNAGYYRQARTMRRELAPKLVMFPFAKAAKHFVYGAGDSVLSFFGIAELLAAEQRRAAPN